ncbi:MAG: hypothetical protein WC641_03855 [Patescibacteria group bacterium]
MRTIHYFGISMGLVIFFGAGCAGQSGSVSSIIDQRAAAPSSTKTITEGCPAYAKVVSSTAANLSSCFFYINPKLPAYEFRLHTAPLAKKDTIILIDAIDVIPVGAAAATQVLTADPAESPLDGANSSYLNVEDLNFDGYKDLELLSSQGATGNTVFIVWLFNPKLSAFVSNETLSNLMNPVPDPKTKTIKSFSNSSAADWSQQTYAWKDERLVLVHEVIQSYEYASETVSCTTSEYSNGKKVKTVKINEGCPESSN